MNFKDATDYWIFCTYETLLIRWMRARVLVETDAEREVLGRIEVRLRYVMSTDLGRYMEKDVVEGLVIQSNGNKYAGPILKGRFQVMEGWIPEKWYLVDHAAKDLFYRDARKEIVNFLSREDAEGFINEFTPPLPRGIDRASGFNPAATGDGNAQENDDMAKAATKDGALKAARDAAAKADAKIGGKRPTPVPEAQKAPAGRQPRERTDTPAPKTERTPRNSMAQAFRDLIMEGKMTDDQIFAAVKKRFPEKLDDDKTSYVKWYRNDLTKAGKNPPEAK